MRRSVIAILTFAMVTVWTVKGYTSERELHGMIIGAVTHVFVNDPTMGHAIFIENMLLAQQNSK